MKQTREHSELRRQIVRHVDGVAKAMLEKEGYATPKGAMMVLFPEGCADDPPEPMLFDNVQVIFHDDGDITVWRDEGGIGPKFIAVIRPQD